MLTDRTAVKLQAQCTILNIPGAWLRATFSENQAIRRAAFARVVIRG